MWEKVWRWADVKMSRCERRCGHEQMWRWADVRENVREDMKMSRCERRCEDEQMWEKMWRWADVREDVKMSRCEDEQMWEKMWRWEDVLQTPTIGRTLRSDALGKNICFAFCLSAHWHKILEFVPSCPIYGWLAWWCDFFPVGPTFEDHQHVFSQKRSSPLEFIFDTCASPSSSHLFGWWSWTYVVVAFC